MEKKNMKWSIKFVSESSNFLKKEIIQMMFFPFFLALLVWRKKKCSQLQPSNIYYSFSCFNVHSKCASQIILSSESSNAWIITIITIKIGLNHVSMDNQCRASWNVAEAESRRRRKGERKKPLDEILVSDWLLQFPYDIVRIVSHWCLIISLFALQFFKWN